jgi:hypothetical protein
MAIVDQFDLLTPEGTGIVGELNDRGVVVFAIKAGEGSSIRGTELFNRMMDYFGDNVVAIHGIWRKNPDGQESTNIDKVNELTLSGMPLEEAVYYAWTATRAKKRGYPRVSVIGCPEGGPGAYIKIDVLIEK